MPNHAQRMMKNATSTDDLGLDLLALNEQRPLLNPNPTVPQPDTPAPANPLAGWTDLHVAGDWLAGRPPNAQAVRTIAQVSVPAPALPAEVREVLLLVAEWSETYEYGKQDFEQRRRLGAKIFSIPPARLRVLAGAEAGEQGG